MANRPTPAFLRPPRAQTVATKPFARFKAETARPEQQAIFRMMVKDEGLGDRSAAMVRAFRSVPGRIALGLLVVSVGLAASHRHWATTADPDIPVPTPGDAAPAGLPEAAPSGVPDIAAVALVPGSRFALSATARGFEPPRPAPVLTPAVSSTTWSLGVAEAHEVRRPPPIPQVRPLEPAAGAAERAPRTPAEPSEAADAPGAGGPFASWVPEPKPAPIRLVPAAHQDPRYHVDLAVVRYPASAEIIREAFVREVPWGQPLEFTLAPFKGGSLQVLSITGLPSRGEAEKMCTLAHAHGFECLLPEG